MDSTLTDGCACGAIRYEIQKSPEFSIICQCRQCQRSTGTGHSAAFAVEADSTTLQGNVKYYQKTSDDGNIVNSNDSLNLCEVWHLVASLGE